MFFLEGEDDNTSVLAGQDLDAPVLTEDGEKVEPAIEEEVKEEPTTPPAFDPAALSTAFAEGLVKAGFKPQAEPATIEKPLTPEEAKKLLNVWEPTSEWQVKYDNLETRADAIREMRDGQIKQADTISQLRMQQMRTELMNEFAPMRQAQAEQEAKQVEQRFDEQYPQLAKPELKGLIGTVIGTLKSSGVLKPRDEAHNFKAVATAVEQIIRVGTPTFKLTPKGSTPSGQTRNNANALRPTTAGAAGGGGGKVAPAKTGNKVLDLLA